MEKFKQLLQCAENAMEKSYSPYSHFAVGAALLTENGKIFEGCNIENAAFTPTVCAERVAIFKAVAEGESSFSAIAVVGGKDGKAGEYCPPCGVCRQVLREFCKQSFKIILADESGNVAVKTLEEMLPMGFEPDFLKSGDKNI